ncbi:nuclear speckle splicing regulatory protein 1 [Quercus suber]|uniref:Nuclear speckle splicing regulatory protein 1 n=1 Tax=Quercus suber TaxID=58331 RepID=A0AAW0LEP1_QUESU
MSKIGYGLNLRLPSQQKKKQQQSTKLPRPPAFGFNDNDEDYVESDISQQASKNKSLKDIEEQQKKALEEDATVFDYDGVYDDMKQKAIQPRVQDRQDRMVVYERKIAKERSQDDHLYADKDKFVTSAYKNKLEEQRKWMEEERLHELQEAQDDAALGKFLVT